jgi:hypothetical protein
MYFAERFEPGEIASTGDGLGVGDDVITYVLDFEVTPDFTVQEVPYVTEYLPYLPYLGTHV